MRKDIKDPAANEWLEDDVSDLLFDDKDPEPVLLAPQYRAVLLEYMGGQPPVTQEQCNTFLAGVASGLPQSQAAEKAGAAWTTFWRLRKSNEVFNLAFEEARELQREAIRDKSLQQSLQGELKAVYYKGRVVGYEVIHPTNPQLQMQLKAAFPEEYRERSEVVERKGEDVQPIGREGDREKLIKMIEKHGVKDDGDDVSDLL